jgi:hypothetical protein
MKVLIYGSKGWIGTQFKTLLGDFVEGKSRVDNVVDVPNEIMNVNPTHVISFIGRTHGLLMISDII